MIGLPLDIEEIPFVSFRSSAISMMTIKIHMTELKKKKKKRNKKIEPSCLD